MLLHSRPIRSLAAAALAALAFAAPAAGQPTAKRLSPPSPPPLPAAIAARLPPAGWLIAHATDRGQGDTFSITRVSAAGTRELVRAPIVPDEAAWLDGRTLVTVVTDHARDVTTVRRYVDGQPDDAATVTVPANAWALPKGKTLVDTRSPELWLGKAGALWLTRCHTLRARGPIDVCTGSAWLRVDGGPTPARKRPATIRRAAPAIPSLRHGGALPKAVKAPAGYAVTLREVTVDDPDTRDTVKGFACSEPGAPSVLWPSAAVIDWQFDVRPTKVRWLAATPPLFAVTGKATDPIGEVLTTSRVFRACGPRALDDFLWLGAGRWAALTMNWSGDLYAGATWTLHVDDVVVATIDAAPSWFLVAPPTP